MDDKYIQEKRVPLSAMLICVEHGLKNADRTHLYIEEEKHNLIASAYVKFWIFQRTQKMVLC